MSTLNRAVRELQSERNRLENQLQRIEAALSTLNNLNGAGRGRGRAARRTGRHLSASARRRIAAAQRARWAKLKAKAK